MTVPMDEAGMEVDRVEALLQQLEDEDRLHKVKLIYCTSYFQNPTGLTLSAERRPRLLEIARRFSKQHRILILEDAAYRELQYDGPALPSIKSYDSTNEFVVISHTFSKPFAPGLKLGYSAMPRDVRHAVLQQKGNHDFGSANITQNIALEALRDGSYLEHGHTLRDAYRKKRDVMVQSLDRYLPKVPGLHRTDPHGGLYVWLSLPGGVNTSRNADMFRTAVSRGILYVPGEYCFQADESGQVPTNHLRLSFGQVALEEIEQGIHILGDVVSDQLSLVSARTASDGPTPAGIDNGQRAALS
jgi:2-aminoadipate transaminase